MTRKSTLLATAVVAGLAAAAFGFSAPASAQGWGMMGGPGPGYYGHMGYGPGPGYGPGARRGYGPGWHHRAYRGNRRAYGPGYGPGWMMGGYGGYCWRGQGWR